jgi:hypothetical protein
MLSKKIMAIALSILSLQACSVGQLKFDSIMEEKVTKKASFDFECPADKLVVSKIDSGSYGVKGCSKKATYVGISSACSTGAVEAYLRENCRVVPDTFVQGQ